MPSRYTYQSTNPRAAAHPLRSLPLYRPASEVFGYSAEQQAEMAQARKAELARFTVTNAEAAVADARRRYVEDRRAIGDANRGISRGLVVRDKRLARSLAFGRFNKTMRFLRRVEAELVIARTALVALQPGTITFRVLAQRTGGTDRLAKVIVAASVEDALSTTAAELAAMGFAALRATPIARAPHSA